MFSDMQSSEHSGDKPRHEPEVGNNIASFGHIED